MWTQNEVPVEFQDPEKIEQLIAESISALDASAEGAPPLPSMGPAAMKTLYAFAYRFYRDGLYEKACDFFRFLTLLDRDDQRHWMGMGAAEQMCQRYEKALPAYAFASALQMDDPFPHFHAAECYFKMRLTSDGHKALDLAEHYAHGSRRNEQLRTHISLLRQNWPR